MSQNTQPCGRSPVTYPMRQGAHINFNVMPPGGRTKHTHPFHYIGAHDKSQRWVNTDTLG